MTLRDLIKEELKLFDNKKVNDFLNLLEKMKNEKNSQNKQTYYWFDKKDHKFFAECFKKAVDTGLDIDGRHISIDNRGLSLDYVAYKNKMLLIYPDTKISFSEVYKDDDFSFEQRNGEVIYSHKFANPFQRLNEDIIGVYCVIKNIRGEFLTLLSKQEIEKHKNIAKTSSIWDIWYVEMAYKTVIKKATRIHFNDIYDRINDVDNESIDLEKEAPKQVVTLNIKELCEELAKCKDLKETEAFSVTYAKDFKALSDLDKKILLVEAKNKKASFEVVL